MAFNISQRHRCLDVDIEDTCMYKSSLIFSVHVQCSGILDMHRIVNDEQGFLLT